MSKTLVYKYPPLTPGILIRRYKRFLADIQLDNGEIITAHCANTGPMTGVCTPQSRVYVSRSDNPKRKLAYTWEMIEVADSQPTWVGINTNLPNKIIKLALQQGLIPQIDSINQNLRTEVAYGQAGASKIDILLGDVCSKLTYIEIKNTTLAQGKLALFPDTVTTRGQKHLRELTALTSTAKTMMIYFINRSDCSHFAPSDQCDPQYAQLLRTALAAGVEVLPLRFEITPQAVYYLNKVGFSPSQLSVNP
jgi:sugar fermentation stimulation protein A